MYLMFALIRSCLGSWCTASTTLELDRFIVAICAGLLVVSAQTQFLCGEKNPSLPNICQGFPDLKQPNQSSSISLSLDTCKPVYFSLHSKIISTEHAWSIWHILEMCGKTISQGKPPTPALLLSSGCPLEINLQLTSWCLHEKETCLGWWVHWCAIYFIVLVQSCTSKVKKPQLPCVSHLRGASR